MRIIDFIKKVNKYSKNSNGEVIAEDTFHPQTLEEEFLIEKFKHMFKTVKLYLVNDKLEKVDPNSRDYMVEILNITKKVDKEIERLIETGEFLTVYNMAYDKLFNDNE